MRLSSTYNPQLYQEDIYALWEKSGSFKPKGDSSSDYFSMVMPPPNANADLHMGHAIMTSVEDIIVRFQRLMGKRTLYVPGADHAGFETWVVYEKKLASQGKTRFDYSREQLYKQVWDFVELNKTNFNKQLRSLGVSCDWDDFTFTLDKKVVAQAYKMFKKMWEDKLIYRGVRLVNFCTYHGTSFSDIEVVYRQAKGKLYYISYPLKDRKATLTIATTRPETMLGDTAIAINPKDKKNQRFIGQTVTIPLVDRDIPIVADEMVDQHFGTGIVKITPAHDLNDYDVAERHKLPSITVIDFEGKINSNAPKAYQGLTVEQARQKVLADLKEQGRLVKEETIDHSVAHCYKCNTVIQPLLREQWFVDMKPLATTAVSALKADKIKFYPKSKQKQSIDYMEKLRDWNISRQIAWGIPIPAFQNVNDLTDWIYDDGVDQEFITISGKTYKRDPDVFDTWFTSGQWPYVTLDYPSSNLFKNFYPLSLMETGGDILYQWVCRMVMLGLYVTGEVPFKEVYIHSTVLSEDGVKMSKSLGNVVPPVPLIDKYGSDAVRMGIIAGRVAGVSRSLDIRKIEDARNFCNKLWNVARFCESKIGSDYKPTETLVVKSIYDAWILLKIQQAAKSIVNYLESYRINEAYNEIYHLVWDEFADWYVETAKVELNEPVLAFALQIILKLAHPFAPFVTETIWQTLAWEQDSLLISAHWPKPYQVNSRMSHQFDELIKIINEIRFLRAKLPAGQEIKLLYLDYPLLAQNHALLESMVKVRPVEGEKPDHAIKINSARANCWLELDQTTIGKLTDDLEAQIKQQTDLIKRLDNRLNNESYIKNAPKLLVDQSREDYEKATELLEDLRVQHKQLAET